MLAMPLDGLCVRGAREVVVRMAFAPVGWRQSLGPPATEKDDRTLVSSLYDAQAMIWRVSHAYLAMTVMLVVGERKNEGDGLCFGRSLALSNGKRPLARLGMSLIGTCEA